MIDPGTPAFFAPASAALIAVPGPAVLYIVTRSSSSVVEYAGRACAALQPS